MAERYVAVSGGTGAGTIGDPWSLAHAIANANAGDVMICRGGQYIDGASKTFARAGAAGNHVEWTAYWPDLMTGPEHVEWICDSVSAGVEVVRIAAPYNRFKYIDSWRKKTDRWTYPGPGSAWWIQNGATTGTELIYCVGHEGSNSFFSSTTIGDVLMYGCIGYYGGVVSSARAHGFYFHHGDSGIFQLLEHTSFDHFGNCGQIFCSNGQGELMKHFLIDGLLCWGGGAISSDGIDSGTATGTQTSTTLQDTNKSWFAGQWPGGNACLTIMTGPGAGQVRTVSSHDGNTLTISSAWTTTPVAGQSTYRLSGGQVNLSWGGTDSEANVLTDLTCRNLESWNRRGTGSANIRLYQAGTSSGDGILLEDFYLVGGCKTGSGRLTIAINYLNLTFQRIKIVMTESDTSQVRAIWLDGNVFTGWADGFNEVFGVPATGSHWRHNGVNRTFAQYIANTPFGDTDTVTTAAPTVTRVVVRPQDAHEGGRGRIWYYNWGNDARVEANVLSFLDPGDSFDIKNMQDLYGASIPAYAAAAGGSPITVVPESGIIYLPTTGVTPVAPYGLNDQAQTTWISPPLSTAIDKFDCFLVRRTAVAQGGGPVEPPAPSPGDGSQGRGRVNFIRDVLERRASFRGRMYRIIRRERREQGMRLVVRYIVELLQARTRGKATWVEVLAYDTRQAAHGALDAIMLSASANAENQIKQQHWQQALDEGSK